jgi:triosephosphate isomerase
MDGGEKKGRIKVKYIIANWKSNKLLEETHSWVESVGPKLEHREDVVVIVCPPSLYLGDVAKAAQVHGGLLKVGSQNVSPFSFGSYTGEETAGMIKQFGEYSIIGHSERRKNFGETDEILIEKVKQALEAEVKPVFCVQDEHTPIPEGVEVVAYEPVFAIGTGTPDTPDNANSVCGKIKEAHQNVVVLYGGSVTSENAKQFLEQEHISGLLIGKASLDAEEFIKIVNLA